MNFTIINKDTLKRRLLNFLLAGLTGIFVLGSGLGIKYWHESAVRNRVVREVRQSIESGDFLLAQKLLDTYDQKGLLGVHYQEELELDLERELALNDLYSAIDLGDFQAASGLLEDLVQNGLIISSDIEQYESLVYEISEQGLADRIAASSLDQRIELCNQYLVLYSSGEHRDYVMQELVYGELERFTHTLENKRSFVEVYAQLLHLNQILDQYKQESIIIPDISNKLSNAVSDQFLDHLIILNNNETPAVGKSVIITETSTSSWNSEYLKDRVRNFPVSTVGTIIVIEGAYVYVEFDPSGDYSWSRSWPNISPYWSNGVKNVARFHTNEICVSNLISDFDRFKFRNQTQILESLLGVYK